MGEIAAAMFGIFYLLGIDYQVIWEPMCVRAKSCLTFCDTMDCSLPGFSVHKVLQARLLEQVAMPSSRGSSQPRSKTQVSHIEGRFFTS